MPATLYVMDAQLKGQAPLRNASYYYQKLLALSENICHIVIRNFLANPGFIAHLDAEQKGKLDTFLTWVLDVREKPMKEGGLRYFDNFPVMTRLSARAAQTVENR